MYVKKMNCLHICICIFIELARPVRWRNLALLQGNGLSTVQIWTAGSPSDRNRRIVFLIVHICFHILTGKSIQ